MAPAQADTLATGTAEKECRDFSMWPWIQSKLNWAGEKARSLDAGAIYRAPCRGLLVETATILGRFDDQTGIPHVRYALRCATKTGASDGIQERVLSTDAFVERYTEYCGTKSEPQAAA